MTRTDIHSPLHLVTEDYDYVGAYDNGIHAYTDDLGHFHEAPRLTERRRVMQDGRTWANTHGHDDDQCDHCGASLRYVALMLHRPTNQVLRIGETCLENRFEQASVDFHRMRLAAELDRKEQRIRTARDTYLVANPDIAEFLAIPQTHPFLSDMVRALRVYGELTERQATAVRKFIAGRDRWRAEREAQAAEPTAPVVEGTITVTGRVLSTRWHDDERFGSTLKMVVRDDRGFKVWGSVPRFHHEGPCSPSCTHNAFGVDAGDRITFTATVTRSERDETFGFFKRPRRAALLEAANKG